MFQVTIKVAMAIRLGKRLNGLSMNTEDIKYLQMDFTLMQISNKIIGLLQLTKENSLTHKNFSPILGKMELNVVQILHLLYLQHLGVMSSIVHTEKGFKIISLLLTEGISLMTQTSDGIKDMEEEISITWKISRVILIQDILIRVVFIMVKTNIIILQELLGTTQILVDRKSDNGGEGNINTCLTQVQKWYGRI